MKKMNFTRNNINDSTKLEIFNKLNQLLSDLINIGLMTKHAHWNIKGKNFIAIHEMLDSFEKSIKEHQDIIAERISQVGGIAFGTIEKVVINNEIEAYPDNIQNIDKTLILLANRYAFIANKTRDLIVTIEDEDTADILTATSRDLDKFLWFIESHIE